MSPQAGLGLAPKTGATDTNAPVGTQVQSRRATFDARCEYQAVFGFTG